jgi:hypothetical protein
VTAPVQFAVESYGSYARASAVADFVELAAWHGFKTTEAWLKDRLSDSATLLRYEIWDRKEAASPSAPGDTRDADARRGARRVFALLEARSRALGDRYPFKLEPRVSYEGEQPYTPYMALLGISTAHASDVAAGVDPKQVFETTVERALRKRGLKVSALARVRRSGMSFEEALLAAGKELGLTPCPDEGIVSVAAHDDGVDTLVHDVWDDERTGRWTVVGQVTCAISNEWEKKAAEPKPPRWMKLLGDLCHPRRFLAVPYHVEPLHFSRIIEGTDGTVLDRIRITKHAPAEITVEERDIIDAVHAAGIEYR